MKPTRRELIAEFRLFLEACRAGDRRWRGTLAQDRRYEGLIEVQGRLQAYDLMSRFLEAAERREKRSSSNAAPEPGRGSILNPGEV